MMKHGAVKLKNQTVSDIDRVSVVRVMLVSVNLDQMNKEKVSYQKLTESNKFVLKNWRSWLRPVLRPASSLLTEFLTCVCGKALCNDLYGEAQLKMSTFFRLQV